MPQSIGLTEAIKLVKDEELDDPRLQEFAHRVESMAMDILKDHEDEYIFGAITFIQATALSYMTSKGADFEDTAMICDNPVFRQLIAVAFKMSVGLAAIEELR